MNNKKVLMIHEIRDWMFELPLEDYILTFDDGLYSQFYYLEELKKINTQKIFFISTNILCPEDQSQSMDFPSCDIAHEDFFSHGVRNNYMKWSQIQKIYHSPNCYIGGHSHNHNIYKDLGIRELYSQINEDTQTMINEFKKQNLEVTKFCFPYNKKYVLYQEILKNAGFTEFYGDERIAIELLKND